MARASPSTSSAVVVVVGARLNGQASFGTGHFDHEVAHPAEARRPAGGDRNELDPEPLRRSQHNEQLLGLPRIRQRDQEVVLLHDAEIAVTRLHRVHEHRRGATLDSVAADLLADIPALADAGQSNLSADESVRMQRSTSASKDSPRLSRTALTPQTSVSNTSRARSKNRLFHFRTVFLPDMLKAWQERISVTIIPRAPIS